MARNLFVIFIICLLSTSNLQSFSLKSAKSRLINAFDDKEYNKAIEIYEKELEDSKDETPLDVLQMAGKSFSNMGNYKKAINIFEHILKKATFPVNIDTIKFDLANLYFSARKYKDAEALYKEIIDKHLENEKLVTFSNSKIDELTQKKDELELKLSSKLMQAEILVIGKKDLQTAVKICNEIMSEYPGTSFYDRSQELLLQIKTYQQENIEEQLRVAKRLYNEEKKYTDALLILNKLSAENDGIWPDVKSQNNVTTEIARLQGAQNEQLIKQDFSSQEENLKKYGEISTIILSLNTEENLKEAIDKLKTITAPNMEDRIKESIQKATDKIVNIRRNTAARLYLSSKNEPNNKQKLNKLNETLEILKEITKDYPQSSLLTKVERNIATIKQKIKEID